MACSCKPVRDRWQPFLTMIGSAAPATASGGSRSPGTCLILARRPGRSRAGSWSAQSAVRSSEGAPALEAAGSARATITRTVAPTMTAPHRPGRRSRTLGQDIRVITGSTRSAARRRRRHRRRDHSAYRAQDIRCEHLTAVDREVNAVEPAELSVHLALIAITGRDDLVDVQHPHARRVTAGGRPQQRVDHRVTRGRAGRGRRSVGLEDAGSRTGPTGTGSVSRHRRPAPGRSARSGPRPRHRRRLGRGASTLPCERQSNSSR